MSQFYTQPPGGSPAIPTSFSTDSGSAIPENNVLNVIGGSTSVSSDNGIRTIASPDLSDDLVVQLTNRITGSATSINGSTVTLFTFALDAVPTSYRFDFNIVGRETTTNETLGYKLLATFKTNGSIATIIQTSWKDADEDLALSSGVVFIQSDGANNVLLRATGTEGKTINYKSVGTYIKV